MGLLSFQIPSSKVELIGIGLPSPEYFGAFQHWVSQEFLHPSQIMYLVLCLIMVMHF